MSRATSVIIPCFNGEAYLPEALESVRVQTAAACEIILVDDGSDVPVRPPVGWDGPPLRIIRTPNRGLAAARNTALAHAGGEFVAFLDADDFWHPSKLARQEEVLRTSPHAAACYTRCASSAGFYGFGPYPPANVPEDQFLLALWYHAFFPPSAVMVRRGALDEVGPFRDDLGNGEDVELWFRLLTRGRFVQVAEPLCYYRQHPGQFTGNIYRKLMGSKRAREEMIARHASRLVGAGLRRDRLWESYRNEVLLSYYRRQFAAARPLLWDYWRDHPLDVQILVRAFVTLMPSGLVARLRGSLESVPAPDPVAVGTDDRDAAWDEVLRRLAPAVSRQECMPGGRPRERVPTRDESGSRAGSAQSGGPDCEDARISRGITDRTLLEGITK
jgi:glycosyltransferase involved in cell wall biosynthesis